MIIYQTCPSCGYHSHISVFGRSNNGGQTMLICPECGKKFIVNL